ncbi:spore protease YyaC [Alkalihalobacillus sp. AL-G]|uniref:spore protease YyaC n=1 Tax=Alkalihalobacillus sp. AL-G TaxID=2926399 RepID=UPI00272DC323|nr:spore protease YyaC [Alkalihalobacillus sp. AL-G]WLD93381.1 spore protease YyaC [Alkalihalobacillus sp. AL-G]
MNLKRRLMPKKPFQHKVHYEDQDAVQDITRNLTKLLPHARPIVIVCIGTDRSTGDSLGPLVGSKLACKPSPHYDVYGTLEEPVHAVNLEERMNEINERYENPFIIGIDACLGKLSSVGMVSLGDGPVKPGAAVKKQLPPVGDIHMTGIVNVSGFMEYFVLQNTRLNLVMKLADLISEGIYLSSLRVSFQNRTTERNYSADLAELQ